MTNAEQWRLRRSAALHALAVVVFAMLALSGAGAATPGLYGLAVPLIVTGLAGAAGAAVLTATVWRQQRADADARNGAGVPTHSAPGSAVAPGGAFAGGRGEATQRTTRLAMAAAAPMVLLAGVILAPRGVDHGFVISVAAFLAAALALFALLAGDRPRSAMHPVSARATRTDRGPSGSARTR